MLPRLRVAGRQVIDASSADPVRLRGVNRSGMEYSQSLEAAGITVQELDEIVSGWGANIVRVPFNQSWALENTAYLAELDLLIEETARRGAYILLDLHWIDAETMRGQNSDGTPNFVPALPNLDSFKAWHELAVRYKDQPQVLYDVFNEPHSPLPDDPVDYLEIDRDRHTSPWLKKKLTMSQWQPWAACLVDVIRAVNPEALIFVPGIDWAYNLRGFPLREAEQVVYSTHVYPNKGNNWRWAFGNLSRRSPVFVGEFGGMEADLTWGESLLQYLDELDLGWAAWSWADHPHLVSTGFKPTAFGALARTALRPSPK